jgi:hypothetical protein
MGDDAYLERGSHPSISATRRPLAKVPPMTPQSSTTNQTSISLDEILPNVKAESKKYHNNAIIQVVSSELTACVLSP